MKDGEPARYTLPGLLVAMAGDEVRDFPALRPHQRHPWHAFLVQLAAMALHHTGQSQPFESEKEWKNALLALTPNYPDGCAWCLISPHDKPAFMQAPVPGGGVSGWKNRFHAADEIDMLVTAKNHDLKAARMRNSLPEDWLMALISLQTQEGFLGAGNYGISRMNGGFGSRPALGVVPQGNWGRRWRRDVGMLLAQRAQLVEQVGLVEQRGTGLVWLQSWDGEKSLAFSSLDPFYIEICRRIRLHNRGTTITAIATGSKAARIEAKERSGITGDPWTPIDVSAAKALTITSKGFNYQLSVDLVFGAKFRRPVAQMLVQSDGTKGIVILAQGVTRGQGKTEGYHERRIPISPTVRKLLIQRKTDRLAKVAVERVHDIGQMRDVLWAALAMLFDNKAQSKRFPKCTENKEGVLNKRINHAVQKEKFSDSAKDKANVFSKPFEQNEDARFFDELNAEMESDQPQETRLQWMLSMADRAETILKSAFDAGPRSSEQRYRARAAALARFHGGLRSDKVLPTLADYYRRQKANKEVTPNGAS
jgi:CRISPR system Cascade subunit CasA